MKFVVPLNDIDYYEQLVEAGAGEFFCGYVPYEWIEKYGMVLPLNRREWFLSGCNFHTMDAMKVLRKKIEKYGIDVSITLNAKYYIPEQYPYILNIVRDLMDHGIQSFIITDIGLLLYLRENKINCNFHLSCLTPIRNHEALKLMNDLSINRYIFSRKISTEDISEIIKENPNIEYEAFFLNERCLFSEEYCNTLLCERVHTTCSLGYNVAWTDSPYFINEKHKILLQKKLFGKSNGVREIVRRGDTELGVRGCGLCMYKDLKNAGVNYLKIVGRMLDPKSIVQDLNVAKEIAELDREIEGIEDFKKYIKYYYFQNKCPISCYYLMS